MGHITWRAVHFSLVWFNQSSAISCRLWGLFLSGYSAPSRPSSKRLEKIHFEKWNHYGHLDLDCWLKRSDLSEQLFLLESALLLGCLNTDFCSSFWIYCMPLGAYCYCDGCQTSPGSSPLSILQALSSVQCTVIAPYHGRPLSIRDSRTTNWNEYTVRSLNSYFEAHLDKHLCFCGWVLVPSGLDLQPSPQFTLASAITSTPIQCHPRRVWTLLLLLQ